MMSLLPNDRSKSKPHIKHHISSSVTVTQNKTPSPSPFTGDRARFREDNAPPLSFSPVEGAKRYFEQPAIEVKITPFLILFILLGLQASVWLPHFTPDNAPG